MLRAWMVGSAVWFLNPAWAGVIPVASVEASSVYSGDEGQYDAHRAIDGKQSTAWVEGESGSGVGSTLTLKLTQPERVRAIKLWAGDWYDEASWSRANRPKELEARFDDGTTQRLVLKDSRIPQVFEVEGGGRETSEVRLRLVSVYGGSAWFDTGLSEVQLLGDSPDRGPIAKITASSSAKPDADGSYEPSQLVDGLSDSMWCEGKDDDGLGQSLTFDFGQPHTLTGVRFLNGNGTSLPVWLKANRTTRATLVFSDGSKQTLEIKPSFSETRLSFPAKETTRVTWIIDAVAPGSSFHDTCISELWWIE